MTAIDADGRPESEREANRAAAMHGGEERVALILHDHGTALLNYFARRVPVAEDAADLLSETMLVLWRRQADVPPDDVEAKMWAYGVARRVLNTHRRSSGRRQALADRVRLQMAAARGGGAREEPFEVHDIRAALRALPALDREVLLLVHWEGFTLAEVARILGARPSSIRSRYTRAKAKLASVLGP